MKKSKLFGLLAVMLVIALMFTACGGNTGDAKSDAKPQT